MTTSPQVAAKVVPSALPSYYTSIQQGALKVVNTIVEKAVVVGAASKEATLKVVSIVRPFFSAIFKFLCESFDKLREFLIANKQVVLPVAVIGTLCAIGALAVNNLLCNAEEGATSATKKV